MGETITVATLEAGGGNKNMQVLFKNCAPFTNCKSDVNNTQIDNAKNIDVVMAINNLIENSKIIQKNQEIYGSNIEMNHI